MNASHTQSGDENAAKIKNGDHAKNKEVNLRMACSLKNYICNRNDFTLRHQNQPASYDFPGAKDVEITEKG